MPSVKEVSKTIGKGVSHIIDPLIKAVSKGTQNLAGGAGAALNKGVEEATKGWGAKTGIGILGATGIPYAGYKTLNYLMNPPAAEGVAPRDLAQLMQAKAYLLQARQKIENQKLENAMQMYGHPKLGSEKIRGVGLFGNREFEKIAIMVRGKFHPNISVIQGGGQPSSKSVKPDLSALQGGGQKGIQNPNIAESIIASMEGNPGMEDKLQDFIENLHPDVRRVLGYRKVSKPIVGYKPPKLKQPWKSMRKVFDTVEKYDPHNLAGWGLGLAGLYGLSNL